MNQRDAIVVPVTEGVPSPLQLTLGRRVDAGTLLRLRASGVMMLRGLKVRAVRAPALEVDLAPVHRFSREEMQRDWTWHIRTMSIVVVRAPVDLPSGTALEVHVEPGTGLKIADLAWTLTVGEVDTVRALVFRPVTESLAMRFTSGPASHMEAYLKPDGRLLVQHFDRYGNPTQPDAGDNLVVTVDGGPVTEITTAPAVAATTIEVSSPRKSGLRYRVVDAAGREALSNSAPLAQDGTPIYFGEFHWHTDFSGDGQRSLPAALTSARDDLGLDFAGPADHMAPNGTYAERLPVEQAEMCRRFDQPGHFCTIPGAELSGRYGHANLYTADFDTFLGMTGRFPETLQPIWQEHADRYPLEALSALCAEGRAMIVPHHTNMDSSVSEGVVREDGRPFWCAMYWPPATEVTRRAVRLVEIVQNRGAFETEAPDPAWRVAWGGFGGSAQTALMRGHRLGFIAGTDNHTGWPTRLPGKAGYGGLTAIQAPSLDTASLFAALYARRCYATSGARIVADATLNGAPMGSELVLAPGAPRVFHICIQGTVPLAAVQIVHLGVVLADLPVAPNTLDFETTWADERPGRPLEDAWYYVRARQVDGHCVWLSPFWVDLA